MEEVVFNFSGKYILIKMHFIKKENQLVLIKRIVLPKNDSYDKKGSFKYFI